MMFHHDDRNYDDALSEAAREMRDKLHRQIEDGRDKGAAAIARVLREVPTDQVVPGQVLEFAHDGDALCVRYGEHARRVHAHALGQMTEFVHLPRAYYHHLVAQGDWGRTLLAKNLNTLFDHDRSRHLVRSVDAQLRGFLSTRYQRRHPAQMLDAFVSACAKVRAVPYEAHAGDTRYMVKAVVDRVLEPVKDEVVALGVVIHESAYGNGATEVSPFVERMWCTNKAVCTTELRKVHIGGRLGDEIEWSEATYEADTRALCLQIQDLVAGQLGEGHVHKLTDTIRAAHASQVEPHKLEAYLKKHLTKDEVGQIAAKYTSADIEDLPRGNSVWRASNALSWFANQLEDPERAFEVQKLAGAVMAAPALTQK